MEIFIFLLCLWLPCGFFASAVANDKDHDAVAWFFGGFIFGPIGLISAAGLSDRKLRRYQRFQAEAQGYTEREPADPSDTARKLIKKTRTGG